MNWFKKEPPKPIITEKVVMPDMSGYATSESIESIKKVVSEYGVSMNKEMANQLLKVQASVESLKKLMDEKKPEKDFSFFKGSGSDDKYLQGLNTGFEIGLRMASTFDEKARKFTQDMATQEAVGRMNGHNKKAH